MCVNLCRVCSQRLLVLFSVNEDSVPVFLVTATW